MYRARHRPPLCLRRRAAAVARAVEAGSSSASIRPDERHANRSSHAALAQPL